MADQQQIEKIIKSNKIPMNQLAQLIETLVEEEVEQELEDLKDENSDFQYEKVSYAIAQLEECLTEVDIYSKLFELRMEQCRLMKVQ